MIVPLFVVLFAGLFIVLMLMEPAVPDRIRLLTGPEGSPYHELGSRYAWFRARNAFKRPPSTVSAAGTDPTIVIPPNLTKEEATSTCPIPTRWASGFVSV